MSHWYMHKTKIVARPDLPGKDMIEWVRTPCPGEDCIGCRWGQPIKTDEENDDV